jgi:hypothetical protein
LDIHKLVRENCERRFGDHGPLKGGALGLELWEHDRHDRGHKELVEFFKFASPSRGVTSCQWAIIVLSFLAVVIILIILAVFL